MAVLRIVFRLCVVLGCAGLSGPAFGGSDLPATYRDAVKTGTVFEPGLSEISGIRASRRTPSVFWVLNDGGNGPSLYAISSGGQLLKACPVKGIKNVDWEDLAGFRHKGADFLLIADVGDNKARRSDCVLYAVKEPLVKAKKTPDSLAVQWQMRFRYENGPRDCEAVAVDETHRRVLLLSKREKYPTLYELPLVFPPQETLYTARLVAKIKTIPPPTYSDLQESYGKYRSRPTSMDISSDGKTLFILTYKHIYRFVRKPGQSWNEAFQSPPAQLDLPLPGTGELIQREALCIEPSSGRIVVTTEQLPAPIYALDPVGRAE